MEDNDWVNEPFLATSFGGGDSVGEHNITIIRDGGVAYAKLIKCNGINQKSTVIDSVNLSTHTARIALNAGNVVLQSVGAGHLHNGTLHYVAHTSNSDFKITDSSPLMSGNAIIVGAEDSRLGVTGRRATNTVYREAYIITNHQKPEIMKTITSIIATALLIISGFEASAQLSDHRFNRTCSEAYEALLAGQDHHALTKLEYLNRARPENDHVAYLLGMVGLRTGRLEAQEVQRLLAQAALNYNPAHRYGDPTDLTAPRTVWLHLGEALALAGRNKEAIDAYRTYMTTIAMAPKEHKSEVIARISELRNGDRKDQLAMLK